MKRLDTIDKKIIRELNDNWRQGISLIGKKLGLSHTAIRSRLLRLERDHINVSCALDMKSLNLQVFMVLLEARFKSKVVNHVKNCPKVLNYYDTFGEYNFIILAVAEDMSTMESMIEQCFSFNFTEITKFSMMPIIKSSEIYQHLHLYSNEEKYKMKCDFNTDCPDCLMFQEKRCVGCPLQPGYTGIL